MNDCLLYSHLKNKSLTFAELKDGLLVWAGGDKLIVGDLKRHESSWDYFRFCSGLGLAYKDSASLVQLRPELIIEFSLGLYRSPSVICGLLGHREIVDFVPPTSGPF